MMKFSLCFLMFIFVRSEDELEFRVEGSSPLVVPLGGSVLLPCSVDKLLPLEMVRVEWRKTDTEYLVHLYYDGGVRAEAQHQDYHDRAHFITDKMKHGNFSLLLENVKKEDKGVYRCKVYTAQHAEKALIEIREVEYLIVSGSNHSVSAYVGEDVTLNCSVDSHIPPDEIKEVSWMKTNKDGNIPVLLYQNKTTRPESLDDRYRDRVEFFTDEIHRGNFSLRLKNVRTEDKGFYMCQVIAGGLSGNTTVKLLQLGFSASHIMVLIFCIAACGCDLFCCLIYCRENNTNTMQILHLCLYFCSSIFMLFASIFWGTTEASLYETISCCAIHILRLLWIGPYIKNFLGKIGDCIESSHPDLYSPAVMVAMYSVLLAEHFKDISTSIIMIICLLLILVCLIFIIQLSRLCKSLHSSYGEVCVRMYNNLEQFVATCGFYLLPSVQFGLLLYPYVGFKTVCFAAILPVFRCVSFCWCWSDAYGDKQCWFSYLDKSVWVLMCVMSVIMVPVFNGVLRNRNDDVGLVCLAGFLQVLWILVFSEVPHRYQKLWNKHMFLFGAVGLVLVSSVVLMTDVILQAVKGQRLMVDQRVGVLPSECVFTIPLLFLPIISPWTPIKMKFWQRPETQASDKPEGGLDAEEII